jgi:Flp pilus assembly protein TadB
VVLGWRDFDTACWARPLIFAGRFKSGQALRKAVSARDERRSRFDYPNAFIAVWMIAMFVAFGLISSLIDQYGVLYNLVQGVFIALFMGAILLLVRRLARRRPEA